MLAAASELPPASVAGRQRFTAIALLIGLAVTWLVVVAPVSLAIAALFLCAGPHNWMEARYILSRLPSRAGPFLAFMALGATGVLALAVTATLLPTVARITPFGAGADDSVLVFCAVVWNLALVAWIAAMLNVRAAQKPVRDWWWVAPAALLLGAAMCVRPFAWSLALVYLHPLVAFLILDRELRARRRDLRPAFHALLAVVPLLIGILWWQLHDAPPLPGVGDDALTMRIVRNAGGDTANGVPMHFLVATHVLLETLHYAVWLLAIPMVAIRGRLWRLTAIPVAARSAVWRRGIGVGLAVSACLVVALWAAFTQNYVATRDLYFTLSIIHVLAEAPLLIRLL